jgi:hypothetical protein
MEGGSSRVFGIILFVLVGASALALGVMNMGKNISEPMRVDPAVTAAMEAALNGQAVDKTKDTDGDGLSDYDELNVYHTSPYIKDSDSDGKSDGEEVKNGTDPNCPEGRDCGVSAPIANTNVNTNESLLNLPVDETPVAGDTAAMAAQIRALLKEQGVSDEMLASFDDQTLIDMYNESAASTANQNSNTNQ